MNRYWRSGVVLALTLGGAACSDFLTGKGLTEDPNNPIAATAQQQLIAFQASIATRLEGQTARNAAIYTQQIIGSNNQQLTYATQYGITEADIGTQMTGYYTGGGLVALRNIQAYGTANDQLMLGIAKVWEGFSMGMAASVFGDLPYREALDPAILTPRLDPQQQIYADVQLRLDEGLAALAAAPTTGTCEPADLIYCSTTSTTRALQVSRWIAAARTMKARFYLHLVERNGNAAYTLALAQANQGINEAPTSATQAIHGQAPGDFRTYHGGTLDVDGNIWAEFLTARGGDLAASNFMIQLLNTRADPRLNQYFTANSNGAFIGLDQNNALVGPGPASQINLATRRQLTFRQPVLTWAENQLIRAEAEFALNGSAAALPFVNAVRTAVGLGALPGPITLQDVMQEKYIVQYQNIDVWNDFKRTCYPTLTRYGTATEIPGRLPYASGERNANPNIPLPSAYPAGTTGSSALRNWNDPAACP